MCGTRITSIYEDGNETSRYSVGSWHAVLFDKSPRGEPFEGTSRDILFWLVSHPAATMIFKMMIQSPVGASRKKKGRADQLHVAEGPITVLLLLVS